MNSINDPFNLPEHSIPGSPIQDAMGFKDTDSFRVSGNWSGHGSVELRTAEETAEPIKNALQEAGSGIAEASHSSRRTSLKDHTLEPFMKPGRSRADTDAAYMPSVAREALPQATMQSPSSSAESVLDEKKEPQKVDTFSSEKRAVSEDDFLNLIGPSSKKEHAEAKNAVMGSKTKKASKEDNSDAKHFSLGKLIDSITDFASLFFTKIIPATFGVIYEQLSSSKTQVKQQENPQATKTAASRKTSQVKLSPKQERLIEDLKIQGFVAGTIHREVAQTNLPMIFPSELDAMDATMRQNLEALQTNGKIYLFQVGDEKSNEFLAVTKLSALDNALGKLRDLITVEEHGYVYQGKVFSNLEALQKLLDLGQK